MSLFNRQRRAWRALPKSQRLKAPTWFTIATDPVVGYGAAFESVADFGLAQHIEGVVHKGPVSLNLKWKPQEDVDADTAGQSSEA